MIRLLLAVSSLSIATAVLAVCAVGCGGDDSSKAAAGAPTCKQVGALDGKSASYRAAKPTVKRKDDLTAVVRTSCGSFSIDLDAKRFPTTVNSFVFLAKRGFYDGLPFDKAGAGTYLEGGDPLGDASGPGYSVEGQIPPSFIYRHGVVAMSQAGRASLGQAGSRFFVVLAKPWLDMSRIYAPLGAVEDGFDVLDRISQFGPHSKGPSNVGVSGPIGKLRHPVVIEEISIEKE
jgi:cyclophilin family peptidyl-prolyl cis-trans isomerase